MYGAMWAANKTSGQVSSNVALTITKDGLSFTDKGVKIAMNDKKVWGWGDELFPLGFFPTKTNWYVYYIAKGGSIKWKLGLATFDKNWKLIKTQPVISDGSQVIGGCDPIFISPNVIALFVERNFSDRRIEVRTASVEKPHILSEPIEIYKFKDLIHHTLILDEKKNRWLMYYMDNTQKQYKLRIAPLNPAGIQQSNKYKLNLMPKVILDRTSLTINIPAFVKNGEVELYNQLGKIVFRHGFSNNQSSNLHVVTYQKSLLPRNYLYYSVKTEQHFFSGNCTFR